MTRRSVAYKRAGVTKFAELRAMAAAEARSKPMPRILCVIDEFQVLLAGNDPMALEAVGLLESLARKGRSYGIHLILASQTVLGVEALYAKRDSIFGQFPVRIALPGGGDVLEPTNDSAAGLPLGMAVVNTAGGLGGPRGATRGHEKVVRFPDPHADKDLLSDLRHKLWGARDPEATPPRIFAGYAHQHLADDPTYRAALAGRAGRPAGTWRSSAHMRPVRRCSRRPPAVWPLSTRRELPDSLSPRSSPRVTSWRRTSPSRSVTGRK
jgi:S-DNA-T family DNA segregation ATPase FtsK/SpoIIIE